MAEVSAASRPDGVAAEPTSSPKWAAARADVLLQLGRLADDVPLEAFLTSAAQMLADSVDSPRAGILTRAGEGAPFVALCATEFPVDPQSYFPDGHPLADSRELIDEVLERRRALILNDREEIPTQSRQVWPGVTRLVVVPIVRRDVVVALAAAEGCTEPYTSDDADMLQMVADLVLSVVEREHAREAAAREVFEHRRTFWAIVEAMSKLTEIRDPYTAGHQRMVGVLSAAIGEDLGFDRHAVDGLQVAGHLHDLGKVGVPSEILVKPGKLSEMEMALVRTHCQFGLDIVDGISFPWEIARPVIEHHERLDGSGYPRGLVGDQIALASRVVMVADVVEAMSSPRPYRSSWSVEAALTEIRLGAGRWYDEMVVDACCRVIERNGGRLPNTRLHLD